MNPYQEKDHSYHFKNYNRLPITLSHGKGARVWDVDGKEYIDMFAGIAVNALGHAHPALVHAIKNQAEKLVHVSNIFSTRPLAELSELLVEASGLDRAFFCNSGLEATEAAFKMARKWAHGKGKTGSIVSLDGCFHGRSIAAIAAGKRKYQEGFDPMPAGFQQVPFNDRQALEKAVDAHTIAVIIEPIQGESGVIPAPADYLRFARKLCDRHGALLIFDEIQCGIARTGALFAWQLSGVKPDVITLAKGLAGGVPVGAVLATEEVASAIQPGDHGTTFGGNPLAAAAALAVLRTIKRDNLEEQAARKGELLLSALRKELEGNQLVREIRGVGLMVGVDLTIQGAETVKRMAARGVLVNAASGNVIRLVPPLIITDEDLITCARELGQVLKEQAREQEALHQHEAPRS